MKKANVKKAVVKFTLASTAVTTIIVVGWFAWLLFGPEPWPGGVRPDYQASDYDWFLTRKAKSAKPILQALNTYKKANGKFPTQATQLKSFLPTGTSVRKGFSGGEINGWIYTADPAGAFYRLWLKLGWDPSLSYSFDGIQGTWTFSPGDGSPETNILLNP